MKKFILNVVRYIYYSTLSVCGILGITQVALSTEFKDTNILVLTISLFAIGHSIKNLIKYAKESIDFKEIEN